MLPEKLKGNELLLSLLMVKYWLFCWQSLSLSIEVYFLAW